MEIRRILYVPLSFLAVNIGIGSYGVAASTLELTQTSQEIRGIDSDSGVAFHASLPTSDHVVIDANIGNKRIYADIDYNLKKLRIRSFSQANGTSISLSAQDIVAFQKLRVSLPAVNTGNRHGEALASFVNLMANAPPVALDISSSGPAFTPICNKIGGPGVATYTLGIFKKITTSVTVGPACYVSPSLGRCGAFGGPDPGLGFVQRFTQQCLNHDQCCVATKKSPPVCGLECFDEFLAAAPGFFFALDCGTTTGEWADNFGFTYKLSGGDSSGNTAFSGKADTPACGANWSVKGTRIQGIGIFFTAKNPRPPSGSCVASLSFIGVYDNCNTAKGMRTDSGLSWSWSRTKPVTSMSSLGNANALPGRQTAK